MMHVDPKSPGKSDTNNAPDSEQVNDPHKLSATTNNAPDSDQVNDPNKPSATPYTEDSAVTAASSPSVYYLSAAPQPRAMGEVPTQALPPPQRNYYGMMQYVAQRHAVDARRAMAANTPAQPLYEKYALAADGIAAACAQAITGVHRESDMPRILRPFHDVLGSTIIELEMMGLQASPSEPSAQHDAMPVSYNSTAAHSHYNHRPGGGSLFLFGYGSRTDHHHHAHYGAGHCDGPSGHGVAGTGNNAPVTICCCGCCDCCDPCLNGIKQGAIELWNKLSSCCSRISDGSCYQGTCDALGNCYEGCKSKLACDDSCSVSMPQGIKDIAKFLCCCGCLDSEIAKSCGGSIKTLATCSCGGNGDNCCACAGALWDLMSGCCSEKNCGKILGCCSSVLKLCR